MITCKDCLCYEACNYHITEETNFTVNECSTGFKSKDQYVKLPVYIGQQVFEVHTRHKYVDNKFIEIGYEVREGKVSMIQQKVDKSWKIRITINSSVCDYALDEFNEYIFMSKAEATAECNRRTRELENAK